MKRRVTAWSDLCQVPLRRRVDACPRVHSAYSLRPRGWWAPCGRRKIDLRDIRRHSIVCACNLVLLMQSQSVQVLSISVSKSSSASSASTERTRAARLRRHGREEVGPGSGGACCLLDRLTAQYHLFTLLCNTWIYAAVELSAVGTRSRAARKA